MYVQNVWVNVWLSNFEVSIDIWKSHNYTTPTRLSVAVLFPFISLLLSFVSKQDGMLLHCLGEFVFPRISIELLQRVCLFACRHVFIETFHAM